MSTRWGQVGAACTCIVLTTALSLMSSRAAFAKDDSELFVEQIQADLALLNEPNKCASSESDVDVEALALQYGRIAETLAHLSLELDSGDVELEYRLSFTAERALRAYELAFECIPTHENRHYLLRALRLISLRIERLESSESFAEVASSVVPALKTRREELAAKLPDPPEPPRCPIQKCPKVEPAPPPPPSPLTERLFIRIEASFAAFSRVWVGTQKYSNPSGAGASLALGPRFLLGKEKRHVLQGGTRASFSFFRALRDPSDSSDPIDDAQVAVYALEILPHYGYRVHPQYLSIHAEVGLGVQAFRYESNFAALQVSPGILVCSLGESLCLSARYNAGVSPYKGHYDDASVLLVGVSLDGLRLAERIRSRHGDRG